MELVPPLAVAWGQINDIALLLPPGPPYTPRLKSRGHIVVHVDHAVLTVWSDKRHPWQRWAELQEHWHHPSVIFLPKALEGSAVEVGSWLAGQHRAHRGRMSRH